MGKHRRAFGDTMSPFVKTTNGTLDEDRFRHCMDDQEGGEPRSPFFMGSVHNDEAIAR